MSSYKMLVRVLFPAVAGLLAVCPAYAIAPAPDFQAQGFQLEFYGGIADVTTGDMGPENVLPNPFNVPANTLSGSTDSAQFAPGLGVGYTFPTKSLTAIGNSYILHDLTLGVNAYYLGVDRTGNVNTPGNPSPLNTYNMAINSWRVMLDAEFDFHPVVSGWIMPFVEGGVGDAINTMNYYETPTGAGNNSVTAQNETTNNLAYEFGGGFKVPLTERSNFSLRYLYSNLGSAEVSDTTPTSTYQLASPLTVNDLHSSSFLLGFNYGFG